MSKLKEVPISCFTNIHVQLDEHKSYCDLAVTNLNIKSIGDDWERVKLDENSMVTCLNKIELEKLIKHLSKINNKLI